VERAKRTIGVEANRKGFGGEGRWFWALPPKGADDPTRTPVGEDRQGGGGDKAAKGEAGIGGGAAACGDRTILSSEGRHTRDAAALAPRAGQHGGCPGCGGYLRHDARAGDVCRLCEREMQADATNVLDPVSESLEVDE